MYKYLQMVSIQEVYQIKTRDELESLLTLEQREQLNLEEETDDTLLTLELVVIHMLINKNEYKLIHAFPGDNAAGLLVIGEESLEFDESHYDHIGINRDGQAFLTWYKEISDDFMDFGRLQSLYMTV